MIKMGGLLTDARQDGKKRKTTKQSKNRGKKGRKQRLEKIREKKQKEEDCFAFGGLVSNTAEREENTKISWLEFGAPRVPGP